MVVNPLQALNTRVNALQQNAQAALNQLDQRIKALEDQRNSNAKPLKK